MSNVSLKNIVKSYDGKKNVIDKINLEIKDREFVVLVGGSGCGKSTILRMIAGLEDITDGEIFIGPQKVNNVHPKDRDIAFVFQSYALYPHMSVYDNMAFGLKMRGVNKKEIDEKVKEAAKTLNLTEYLDRKPKQLSGGQRQRVALGRAIVRNPKVFLMDEPLSNLDAKLRIQMRSEIKKLHEKLKTTFIYVTHDQTEAMTLGDRIVVLDNGVIQQVDTPLNIYNRPANVFVAEFIGQMNFINAFIINKTLIIGDTQINLDMSSYERFENRREVLLGIRPENMLGGEIKLKVKVDLVEILGNEKIVYFYIDNRKCSARVPVDYNVDEEFECAFSPSNVHIFDVSTTNRIN